MDLHYKADMLTFPIDAFAVKNPTYYYFFRSRFYKQIVSLSKCLTHAVCKYLILTIKGDENSISKIITLLYSKT